MSDTKNENMQNNKKKYSKKNEQNYICTDLSHLFFFSVSLSLVFLSVYCVFIALALLRVSNDPQHLALHICFTSSTCVPSASYSSSSSFYASSTSVPVYFFSLWWLRLSFSLALLLFPFEFPQSLVFNGVFFGLGILRNMIWSGKTEHNSMKCTAHARNAFYSHSSE